MIQTIKVLIGIAVLYGALLFTFYGGDFAPPSLENLNSLGAQSLRIASLDQNFRSNAIGPKSNQSVESVKQNLEPLIQRNFWVELCDENNRCVGQKPQNGRYVITSYFVEGNSTTFNPTQVRVYLGVR